MAYEYEGKLLDYVSGSKTYEEYKAMSQELQEVYRKAKAFDKIVEFYPQKDEIPSDEFFDLMGYIIEGREVDGV
ncbi:hypothetical protein ASS95_07160 [Staphylococcus equorum]|uniref:hypothetical protein n=1 Tax=Staphylococcus equorum TaxID=246432 RepID=UPI0008533809|nr:hypothetical protein [Staphylococcus equorum]OEK54308.1 hypothetical protein ASS95_07160 [Staphylococcus equorum]